LDLQLTRRGDYAVRAAIALARAVDSREYRKIREIAAEMAIPPLYTHEILTLLVRAGLVETLAGKQGGYRLLRQPAAVSLLEVVEAAEGPLRLDRCTLSGGPCHWQDTTCAVHPVWEEASKSLTQLLRSQSLAQVVETDARLRRRQGRDAFSPDVAADAG
jgi:Rrf2 family protein